MPKSGLKHIDVGAELSKTEWESEDSHELLHGNSFPGSPVERQLFYRDDEHKWYIYDGSGWVWLGGGSGGGMEVHGNEYHDPDFASEAALAAHAAAATGVHGVGDGAITSKILTSSIGEGSVRSTTSTSYVDIPNTTVTLTIVVTCKLLLPFAASLSHGTAGQKVNVCSDGDTGVYIFFLAQSALTTGQEATAGFTGYKPSVAAGNLSYVLKWKVFSGTGYTCYTKHTMVAIPT